MNKHLYINMRHFKLVVLIIGLTFFNVVCANDSQSYVQRPSANLVSEQTTESAGNKSYNDAPAEAGSAPFVYENSTFSSQREMLDFIKTLDFDRNPPAKRLCDFYNDEKKITEDKVLRKGIELYQKGKARKAADYFVKIYKSSKKYTQQQRDYAAWQVGHYILFGNMDVYYNGRPSRMSRNNVLGGASYKCDTYLSLGYPYLFVISEPGLPSYDPVSLLKSLTSQEEYFNKVICTNPLFTKEFLAAALYEAFPKNKKLNIVPFAEQDDLIYGTKPLKYTINEKSSIKSRAANFVETITEFFNLMDCMHLVARTQCNLNEYYGIGMTAEELYRKAILLNPDKRMDLINSAEGVKNMTDNDEKCQILLLRSVYYGHPDAALELMPYIVETVQFAYNLYVPTAKHWEKEFKEDGYEAFIMMNQKILNDIACIMEGFNEVSALKDFSYIWDAMKSKINYADNELRELGSDHLYAKNAEKRAKKERRAQFWNNMGNVLLNGLASGVNTYMQTQYQVSAPMNVISPMAGNYTGSLADAMSHPGYFKNVQQQLLQQSMNQVQWAEMQEYNAVRENYQRIGRDLSLKEFRVLKGQAIADLKAQGYDIMAEQKAINDELHYSNRGAMNSGKENVERIKQQNAAKYGGANAANASSSNKSNSTKTSTSSSSPLGNYAAAAKAKAMDNDSDTVNAYRYKQRKVNLHENPNSNSAVVFKNCEVYQKGSHYFVKIGEQYYQVHNCNKRYYNRTITYGSHSYYFNM